MLSGSQVTQAVSATATSVVPIIIAAMVAIFQIIAVPTTPAAFIIINT